MAKKKDPVFYNPFTRQPSQNRGCKCGDCGKWTYDSYSGNEIGLFNHRVCFNCWVKRGTDWANDDE